MMLRFVFVCCFSFFSSLYAASFKLDSLTVGPTIYSNVTILGANVTDLYFTHARGIANVKLKYLSPELKKQFNYDPKAAAEAEKKQNESDLRYQTDEATTFFLHGEKPTNSIAKALPSSENSLADPISERSLLGRQAPTLDPDRWLGDKPALEGKFVLIDFWAPWSIPCRKCIPDLNVIHKTFKDRLVVVGWTSEGTITNVNDFKMEFPSAVDSKAKLSASAGVTSVPCVLLVDAKGIVRYQGHPGAITEKKLNALINETDAEK